MQKLKLMKVFIMLAMAMSLQAQTFVVLKTTDAITINGVLSEPAWEAANSVTFSNSGRSDNQAKVSMLWSGAYLYFGFEITDSQLQTDGPKVWDDDGVEIFLDTPNTKSTYDFHFILNIDGELVWEGTDQITFKTVLEGAGYKTEIAVPWAETPVTPVAGEVLGGIFGFNERDGTTSSQVDWLGILENGNYRQPHLWGNFELSAELANGPPDPPDTTVTAEGSDVKLAWDPNTESDLAGYKNYHGLSPRVYSTMVDVGNTLSYTFADLTTNWIHYFAVTAYDWAGNESQFSLEVSAFLEPPQSVVWDAPQFKLLTDTLDVTRENLMATPPAIDTLAVEDKLWMATWKSDSSISKEGWTIKDADSLRYRFKAASEPAASYQYYIQRQGVPEVWLLTIESDVVYEIGVEAHKSGGDAQFAPSAYFRQPGPSKGFILLQLRR